MYEFEAMTFNIHGGYLEAIVRGYGPASSLPPMTTTSASARPSTTSRCTFPLLNTGLISKMVRFGFFISINFIDAVRNFDIQFEVKCTIMN
ncbi:hypothetical protein SLEP1_g52443 [Rubroshorea leprosula]|uniref:Uncharacterized protein n=1 Tax=Rubroshorea leprosula TaxID=152421 RepID=A0AAV5MA08_9ROSI|nr:hypothetical protein SLEP1_g52443 [Rubroshorea leprosula]